MDILERAFRYYIENQNQFVHEYDGKYIVLVEADGGFKVFGDYNSRDDAIQTAMGWHQLGTFLVQKVSPGPSDYTLSLPARMRVSYH